MANFELSRSTVVAADPATVHALIDDFHRWRTWSPWEDRDPDLQRTYGGADAGVGATYGWSGKKAGQGRMEITSSAPERVEIALRFVKPIKADNRATFYLRPTSIGTPGTEVTWRMTGQRNVLMAAMGKLFADRMVGRDFEKGLAQLKAQAEAASGRTGAADAQDAPGA